MVVGEEIDVTGMTVDDAVSVCSQSRRHGHASLIILPVSTHCSSPDCKNSTTVIDRLSKATPTNR